ncbi:hypothetical protein A2U01_0057078, partial [Trifolium medium]|nr:hypothetical protein [Trifolium medium]
NSIDDEDEQFWEICVEEDCPCGSYEFIKTPCRGPSPRFNQR